MAPLRVVLEKNLKISGSLHTIPLEWYTSTNPAYSGKLLRPITKSSTSICLEIKSFLSKATILMIIFQTVYKSFEQNGSNSQQLVINWMLLAMIVPCTFHLQFCKLNASELAAFLNALIQFDKMYPKQPKTFSEMKLQDLLGVVILKAAPVTQVVVPLGAVFGLHLMNPFKASLGGYWLIPDPNTVDKIINGKIPAIVIKFAVLLYNYWIWNFMLTMALFVVIILHYLCITTLLGNFEM